MKINEIYQSIQGESSFAGLSCSFIRTTGCSLRCSWCDTEYSFYQGQTHSIEEILEQVEAHDSALVEVTGGEPLDQKETLDLLTALCDAGHTTLLETGGHKPIKEVDPRVHIIMDLKCPSSKMQKRNHWGNLQYLKAKDEVKFVIGDREDYEWAREVVLKHQLDQKSHVLFSPVYKVLDPQHLVSWILEDKLPVRFQLQLHKYVWKDGTPRV